MDLKSGYPYFLLKSGLYRNYEQLQEDHSTEVAIIGGGVSGALVAHALTSSGISCCIVDARCIAMGSTCSSTSLLQYEIDIPLHKLSTIITEPQARFAYQLCSNSIDRIEEISREIGFTDFSRCKSLYFLDRKVRRDYLQEEFEARSLAGFDVELLGRKEISRSFGLKSDAGILSKQAARIDAYRFTHALCTYNVSRGLKVFEQCEIKRIRYKRSGPELKTAKGYVIKAKKLVYASGYEIVEQISKSIVRLKSTFACVSRRIHDLPEFFKDTIFWNTADPYLYIREDDGRLIVGGRDEDHNNPGKRDRALVSKMEKLQRDIRKVFPEVDFEAQFSWGGTFGATKDGLPYIGCHPDHPHCYFALGFGGNGITFSAIAADMIAAHITGRSDDFPSIFSFNR